MFLLISVRKGCPEMNYFCCRAVGTKRSLVTVRLLLWHRVYPGVRVVCHRGAVWCTRVMGGGANVVLLVSHRGTAPGSLHCSTQGTTGYTTLLDTGHHRVHYRIHYWVGHGVTSDTLLGRTRCHLGYTTTVHPDTPLQYTRKHHCTEISKIQ